MKKQFHPTGGLIYLAVVVALLFLTSNFLTGGLGTQPSYAQILEYFETEDVRNFTLSNDGTLTMELYSKGAEELVTAKVGDVDQFHKDLDALIQQQSEDEILVDYNYLTAKEKFDWASVLPYVLLGMALIYLIMMTVNRNNGSQNPMGKFTKANARVGDSGPKVTFADVAGAEEEKEELQEVVEFLRDPDRFTRLGARIP